ncbi:MAG TPA: hypothetical protein VGS12_05855 [Caulobacteraceae bacterium]|nr:hypothetical protein [Caulobacteraceae bacterium]
MVAALLRRLRRLGVRAERRLTLLLAPLLSWRSLGADRRALSRALEALERSGFIEYTGEFGAEITTFVPFVHWLKQQGHLEGRRVLTYRGMRPYYFFLSDDEYEEKSARRCWLPPADRTWPTSSTYTATRRPWRRPVDYRTRYASSSPGADRPLLFIQNKFTVEWNVGPVNFMPIGSLETLFSYSEDRFDVVYSRAVNGRSVRQFTPDHSLDCNYPDLELARERFPRVRILEDICAETGAPYNELKLEILARSHLFAAVQGGGSHLLACFPNSVLLLLHVDGQEYPHAYAAGPYKHLADPPPLLLLARTPDEFQQGAELLGLLEVRDGRVRTPPDAGRQLKALRF